MQRTLSRSFTRRLRTGGVAAVLAFSAFAFTAAGPAGTVIAPQQAAAACKKAKVGGQTKCLGRGQFCAPRNQSDYRRAGFYCGPDGKGRNRLK